MRATFGARGLDNDIDRRPTIVACFIGRRHSIQIPRSGGSSARTDRVSNGPTPARWQRSSAAECIGIDHSAISIAATERSITFYERLGLARIGGSLNIGPAQEKLDDVAGAVVKVTALAPPTFSTPHVELLCYRGGFDGETALPDTNDVAATSLVMKVESEVALKGLCAQSPGTLLSGPVRFERGALRAILRDPDGHLLTFETSH